MAQFDKNIKIGFILDDIESIKTAHKEYREMLKTDEVVKHQVFQVEFVKLLDDKMKPLQLTDGNPQDFQSLSFSEASFRKELDFNGTASEAIFFSHSLKYPELINEVVETAQEIVNYARRHNDTWEMWVDDMGVFGIDALYILAQKHPEYAYFIGGFIIPYWDSEHAGYVFDYMTAIYKNHGLNANTIKMFCYCDNDEARQAMLGHGWYSISEDQLNLHKHFVKNKEDYKLFKDTLIDRFKHQRYLQYSESSYTDKPVHELFKTILHSNDLEVYEEDDSEEVFDTMFVTDTYGNEASALQEKIESLLGESMVDSYVDPYDIYTYDETDEDEIWENLFLEGFDDGEEIWNYICYGEDDSILDDIEETDLMELARGRNLLINKKFEYNVGEIETLRSQFHIIFRDFIYEYYEEPDHDGGFIVTINGQDPTGRHMVIRAIEVFNKIFGEKSFHYNFYELIVGSKIMKAEAFSEKFDQNTPSFDDTLIQLLKDFLHWNGYLMGEEARRIYLLMRSNPQAARNVLTSVLEPHCGLISMATYWLYQDYLTQTGDDLTKLLMSYVEENWLDVFLSALSQKSQLSPDDLSRLRIYFDRVPAPPQELMIKMLTLGPDGLTDEEKATIENFKQMNGKISHDDVVELLKKTLHKSVKDDDPQIHYKVLESSSSLLSLLIPTMYLGVRRIPLPCSKGMIKAMKILVALAPMKTADCSSYVYKFSYGCPNHDKTIWYDFEQDMKSIGMTASQFLAWEIIEDQESKIESLVETYIENEKEEESSFFKTLSRKDIDEALKLIPDYERDKFMDKVEDAY